MLHIIKQYKQLLEGFIVSKINEKPEAVSESTEKNNQMDKAVDNFLDLNKRFSSDTKDRALVKEMQTAIKNLGVNISVDGIWGPKSGLAKVEALNVADEFEKLKIDEVTKAQKSTKELSEEGNFPTKPETTVDPTERQKEIKRIKQETRKTEMVDEERESVDEKSFKRLLRDIEKILYDGNEEIEVKYKKDIDDTDFVYKKITKENYVDLVTGSGGHLWIERIANKLGYEDNRSAWTKITTLGFLYFGERKSLEARQKNVDKLNTENLGSVKDYLFDFDVDGDIDTELRDALTEISIDDYVKSEQDIKNLLENIGFGTDLSVLKKLSFRDQFSDRLVEVVKLGVPFTVLAKKGGYQEFMKKYTKLEAEVKKEIENSINDEALEKSVWEELKDSKFFNSLTKNEQERKVEDVIKVKKDVTIAISMGYVNAIGANIDISGITNGILDGVNVGINEKGEILVGVNKNLLREKLGGYKYSIDAALSTVGLGANVSVSRNLANETNDDNVSVTFGVGGGLSYAGTGYLMLSGTITNPAVDNVEGINNVLSREAKVYDNIMKAIEDGKTSFSNDEIESWYDKDILGRGLNDEEIQAAKDNIDDIVNKYETLIKPIENEENKKELSKKLKKSILQNLVNSLYTGATGLQLTGVGGFYIPGVIGGAFPILEYNWITHDVTQNELADKVSSEVTKMPIGEFVEKYGSENTSVDGTKYISKIGNTLKIKNDAVNLDIPKEGVLTIDNGDGYTIIKAADGVDINAIVTQRYVLDKKEDATYKQFDLKVDVKGEAFSEGFNRFPELRSKLALLESGFNFNTRHNIKGELLNPAAQLPDRWDSLLNLAQLGDRLKNKKYSEDKPGVGALGKTGLLELVSNQDLTNIEKEYVISRVSQFLKKSHKFDSGNLQSWNDANKLKEFIAHDIERRPGMEKGTFPYSFAGEAEKYYTLLREREEGTTVGTSIQTGLSFDSASTIVGNGSKHGVDVFKGDCEMLTVDGKPLSVEITDPKKIQDLKERAANAGIANVDNLVFHFYKDPDGFDDRVMVGRDAGKSGTQDGTGLLTGSGSSTTDGVNQVNHSLGLIPVWTWDDSKPETNSVEEVEEETKKPDQPEDPESTKTPPTKTPPTSTVAPDTEGSAPVDTDVIPNPAPAPDEVAPTGL